MVDRAVHALDERVVSRLRAVRAVGPVEGDAPRPAIGLVGISVRIRHDAGAGRTERGCEPAQRRQVPSLRSVLDRERVAPSYSMEKSLLRIAEALAPLPGPKSLVVVGHGFGRLSRSGVTLEPAYDEAREALQRARATVFCLDVTDAD